MYGLPIGCPRNNFTKTHLKLCRKMEDKKQFYMSVSRQYETKEYATLVTEWLKNMFTF
jgi:hypothetical protein